MNSSILLVSFLGLIGDGWLCVKLFNGFSSVNWLLEFCFGELWKGYLNIDFEIDFYVIFGSVINNFLINIVWEVDYFRDRNSGLFLFLNIMLFLISVWLFICVFNYNVFFSSIV